jgi:hypothetical protein
MIRCFGPSFLQPPNCIERQERYTSFLQITIRSTTRIRLDFIGIFDLVCIETSYWQPIVLAVSEHNNAAKATQLPIPIEAETAPKPKIIVKSIEVGFSSACQLRQPSSALHGPNLGRARGWEYPPPGFKLDMPEIARSNYPQQASATMETQNHRCKWCGETFNTELTLAQHKMSRMMATNGNDHTHCEFCTIDFKTMEARKAHIVQVSLSSCFPGCSQLTEFKFHPQEQALQCPGCHQTYVRMAGFMAHLEKGECSLIGEADLKQHQEKKRDFSTALHQLATNAANISIEKGHRPMPLVDKNQAHPVFFTSNDFPKMETQAYRDGNAKVADLLTGNDIMPVDEYTMGQWGKPESLFPDAPRAQRPTLSPLAPSRQLNAKDDSLQLSKEDVRHPAWNAENHFNKLTGKYNCPMPNCVYVINLDRP